MVADENVVDEWLPSLVSFYPFCIPYSLGILALVAWSVFHYNLYVYTQFFSSSCILSLLTVHGYRPRAASVIGTHYQLQWFCIHENQRNRVIGLYRRS
jgi:hypothetical protein